MRLPGGYGVVLHASLIAAFAAEQAAALLAVDDADADATAMLVPMLGYTEVYRRFGHTERGAEMLDTLLDIGVTVDAALDRDAARGTALTVAAGTTPAEGADAETAWHARRRGWPVLAAARDAARLAAAFPDLRVVPL